MAGVVDVRRATIAVPSDLADLGSARGAIVEQVVGWAAPVDPDVLALLVGELVVNAVEHGAPPIEVSVEWDGSRVRVEVHDGAAALPVQQQPVAGDDGGRGIWLVEHGARTWGVSEDTSGKSVWFELGC
ncbi:MAG: ATP-binding protein [Actinomycetota bacterium]|nr:ATP-binding protein [Actinomycetota bacterium]